MCVCVRCFGVFSTRFTVRQIFRLPYTKLCHLFCVFFCVCASKWCAFFGLPLSTPEIINRIGDGGFDSFFYLRWESWYNKILTGVSSVAQISICGGLNLCLKQYGIFYFDTTWFKKG